MFSLLTVPLVSLVLAAPVRDDAMSLIARAIKAQGGDEKLSKAQGVIFNLKATAEEKNIQSELNGTVAAQGTEYVRGDLNIRERETTEKIVVVITPSTLWAKEGDRKVEDGPPEAAFLRDVIRALRLSQNLSGLRSDNFKVSYLGESKIDDRTALGLKISAKDHVDIHLYLDKATALPLCAELRVKEAHQTKETLYSFIFSDYKEINGMQHFTRVQFKRDEKSFMDIKLSDFKFQENLDPALFAKP